MEHNRIVLENLIFRIKDARNEVSHKPHLFQNLHEKELKKYMQDFRDLYKSLLQEGFRKSRGFKKSELNKSIRNMKCELQCILEETEKSYKITKDRVSFLASIDIQNNIMFKNLEEKYLEVSFGNTERKITSSKVLEITENEQHPNLIKLIGQSGMGKTSYCK